MHARRHARIPGTTRLRPAVGIAGGSLQIATPAIVRRASAPAPPGRLLAPGAWLRERLTSL